MERIRLVGQRFVSLRVTMQWPLCMAADVLAPPSHHHVQSPSPAAGRSRAGGAALNSTVGGATEPDQETWKQVCGTFSNPLSLAMDGLPHSHVSFPRAKNPAAQIVSKNGFSGVRSSTSCPDTTSSE